MSGTRTRKFLVWMYSRRHPIWSMPKRSALRIQEELGEEWSVRFLEEEVHASGDGVRGAPDSLLEEIREAEVYCGFGIPRPAFRRADRLRWVHSGAAGVGGSLFEEMRESEVVFTNSAGLHAEPLGDHALAMMLYFARGLDVATRGMGERRWVHEELAGRESPLRELSGRTVGVVGYGGIGGAVGRRAAALGMRVVGLRRNPARVPGEVERMWGPAGLPHLLEVSDYVVVCVPRTSETGGLIGAGEFARLRSDAVLINLSRGGIVDEEALADAVRAGRLRGAGLDVFRREPLPAESPLWDLERVLITPHSGGVSSRFWERETGLIVRNVRRYRNGDPLENVVDKERGY